MKKIIFSFILFTAFSVNSQEITLDTNYGDNGYTAIPSITSDDATKSAILADGSVLMSVLKYNANTSKNQATLIKYDSDGTVDTNFATQGSYVFSYPDDNGYDIFVDSNENIYLFASTFDENYIEFGAIFKLLPSGTLDTSFGDNGIKTIDYRCREYYLRNDFIYIITQDDDNSNGNFEFIQKMDLDGNFVTYLNTSVSPAINANTLYVSENNEVYIVGVQEDNNTSNYITIGVKFDADGNLDTNFGNNGVFYSFTETNDIVPEYGNFTETPNSIYLSMAYTGNNFFSEIYQFDIVSGSLESDFGSNGVVQINNDYITALKIYNEELYVLGIKIDSFDTQINSYDSDTGVLNTDFSENGYYIEPTNFNQIPFSLYLNDDFFVITGRNQYSNNSFEHYSSRYLLSNPTSGTQDYSNVISFENPIRDVLTINAISKKINSLKIFSIEGKLIKESNSNSIDTSALISNLYILNCHLENGNIVSKKIIKQ